MLPIILPSVVGIGLFGFTLSWDELARSSQAIGSVNTLPLELQGLTTTVTKPDIYARTLTSAVRDLLAPIRVPRSRPNGVTARTPKGR